MAKFASKTKEKRAVPRRNARSVRRSQRGRCSLPITICSAHARANPTSVRYNPAGPAPKAGEPWTLEPIPESRGSRPPGRALARSGIGLGAPPPTRSNQGAGAAFFQRSHVATAGSMLPMQTSRQYSKLIVVSSTPPHHSETPLRQCSEFYKKAWLPFISAGIKSRPWDDCLSNHKWLVLRPAGANGS